MRQSSRKNRYKSQKNTNPRHTGIPEIVKRNTGKPAASEMNIESPALAIPNADTYGTALPAIKGGQPAEVVIAKKPRCKGAMKAIAFIDYEHWFYSMGEKLGVRPNIAEWYGFISKDDLIDVRFYADFSQDDILRELPRIRSFDATVLDTRCPNTRTEKDFTDFILLNDLYRVALTNQNIEKVILLSGDGHFSPAVSFLKTVCGLKVDVYGVKGCISTSQRFAATTLHELPGSMDYLLDSAKDVLSYIRKVKTKSPWYNFSFVPLTEQVSNCYGYDIEVVRDSIETLIRKKYLQRTLRSSKGKDLSILEVDWDAVFRDGLAPTVARFASTGFTKLHEGDASENTIGRRVV